MKKIILTLSLSFFFYSSTLCANTCSSYFIKKTNVSSYIQKNLEDQFFMKNSKGYAIIITIMLFTSGTSSYITSHLTTEYPFMTYFISQISVLGIVVIGAPIWEPLSSYIRNTAFRWNKEKINPSNTDTNNYLENLWHTTQQKYSINAQMSRNVLISAMNSLQMNMYIAHKAFQNEDSDYAVLQISAMTFRLKTLFSEIPANDPHITAAFRSIVGIENIKNKNPDLTEKILIQISKTDPEYQKNHSYYVQLLRAWL